MKNFHESRKTGVDARIWLPAALAAGVLTLFYAMCMLDARSTQETPQVVHVQLPARPIEPTQNMLRTVEISTTLVVIAERASTVPRPSEWSTTGSAASWPPATRRVTSRVSRKRRRSCARMRSCRNAAGTRRGIIHL